jgi:hypothetical protein
MTLRQVLAEERLCGRLQKRMMPALPSGTIAVSDSVWPTFPSGPTRGAVASSLFMGDS